MSGRAEPRNIHYRGDIYVTTRSDEAREKSKLWNDGYRIAGKGPVYRSGKYCDFRQTKQIPFEKTVTPGTAQRVFGSAKPTIERVVIFKQETWGQALRRIFCCCCRRPE